MPVRFLRPGLTTSERWNCLDWLSQSFYVRLITLVDDYGRYDANLRLLKAHAFPLRDDINHAAIVKSCQNLLASGLVVFFLCPEGKPYLQLTKWHERARSESRFPDPQADTCKHLLAVDSECLLPTPSSSPLAIALRQPAGKCFQKPTIEEVKAHGLIHEIAETECEKFFHFYESNGWRVGKNPMKSWQSAMQNWKRNIGNMVGKPSGKTKYVPNLGL